MPNKVLHQLEDLQEKIQLQVEYLNQPAGISALAQKKMRAPLLNQIRVLQRAINALKLEYLVSLFDPFPSLTAQQVNVIFQT